MQYDAQTAKVPALSRTWEVVTLDRMDGAVVQTRTQTVTLSKVTGKMTAEVDGQPVTPEYADAVLRYAEHRTVTAEVIPVPAGMLAHAQGVRW